MQKNTKDSFGFLMRFFHWLVGAMIITLLAVGFYMSGLENSPDKFQLYGIHKAFGVTVLALVVLRLLWRLANVMPDRVKEMPAWQHTGYKIGVFFMYIFMFAMPMSGLLMSLYGGYGISVFGLFTISSFGKNIALAGLFHELHHYFGYGFAVLISIHSLMALYHHFVVKDRALLRMIAGK
jgi:cytochrome b561